MHLNFPKYAAANFVFLYFLTFSTKLMITLKFPFSSLLF